METSPQSLEDQIMELFYSTASHTANTLPKERTELMKALQHYIASESLPKKYQSGSVQLIGEPIDWITYPKGDRKKLDGLNAHRNVIDALIIRYWDYPFTHDEEFRLVRPVRRVVTIQTWTDFTQKAAELFRKADVDFYIHSIQGGSRFPTPDNSDMPMDTARDYANLRDRYHPQARTTYTD